MCAIEKKDVKKWFERPELEITLFRWTALRLGLFCSYFMMTLLAHLIILYLTNIGILGMTGLKTLSFSKAGPSSG
jgi:hypothetical protein